MDQAKLEKDNEVVVAKMIAAWEARDIDAIMATMHEDVVFQMFEGAKEICGADEVRKSLEPFVQGVGRIEWEMVRSHSVGALVVNERIDRFFDAPDGKGGKRDMEFPVTGTFWIRDGKIAVWRDYSIPGRSFKM